MADMERVAKAIRAFENGEMVVVTDDDDRENEGDLIVAATKITPEQMGFIIRHSSGIVCAPMTGESARRLNLNPMVAHNDAPLSTAFTVSVDYKHGTTTGISAEERCITVHGLANGNAVSSDFVRPWSYFPADRQGRRRVGALRSHRSGCGSVQSGRSATGWCYLRAGQ